MRNEPSERVTQLRGVLLAQVDLVSRAVEPEADGLVGLTAVDVVEQQHLNLLYHDLPLSMFLRVVPGTLEQRDLFYNYAKRVTHGNSHRLVLVGGPMDGDHGSLLATTVGRHQPPYICTGGHQDWHHYRASGDPIRYLYMGPCGDVEHPNGEPHDHE